MRSNFPKCGSLTCFRADKSPPHSACRGAAGKGVTRDTHGKILWVMLGGFTECLSQSVHWPEHTCSEVTVKAAEKVTVQPLTRGSGELTHRGVAVWGACSLILDFIAGRLCCPQPQSLLVIRVLLLPAVCHPLFHFIICSGLSRERERLFLDPPLQHSMPGLGTLRNKA